MLLSKPPTLSVRLLPRESLLLAYPLIREAKPEFTPALWLASVEKLMCAAGDRQASGVLAAERAGSIRGACTYSVNARGARPALMTVSDFVVLELFSPPDKTAEALVQHLGEIAARFRVRSIELELPPLSDWVAGLGAWRGCGLPIIRPAGAAQSGEPAAASG